jgi:acetyltransferase-like isoleucine patch superfamily enzyme
LTGIRGRLVEAHRKLTYERPPLLSELRRHAVVLRHQHGTIVFEGPVHIGPGFSLFMPGEGLLRVGAGVEFRRDCRIEMEHGSEVVIGAGTRLTYGVVIQCTRRIQIGERCLFANGASVVDSKHRFREADIDDARGLEFEPVTIGDGVWVSSKATVAADVGERAVVAANSVVTKPVPAWTLVGGVPAQPIETFGPPTA